MNIFFRVAISRHANHSHDYIASLIGYDKRSDDWFSVRQCMAQYENIVRLTSGPRKKRKTERADHDVLDTLEATLQEGELIV